MDSHATPNKTDPSRQARVELQARRRRYEAARKLRIAYQRRGDWSEVPELRRLETEAYSRLREALDAQGAGA